MALVGQASEIMIVLAGWTVMLVGVVAAVIVAGTIIEVAYVVVSVMVK